ncbi:hypothetical protein TSUD_161410 [Trifolium subterraneum]|uniref:Uncharacterized protein n=1 Tax=Trifolium subterraneum TaxID=3900 RepID=A0A2Z6MUM1_TRISU|nr:hypothetical protein TSUD_161410 [Trifolium subterraneum]
MNVVLEAFLPLQLCFVVYGGVRLPVCGSGSGLVVVEALAFYSVLLFAASSGGGCWLIVMEEFVSGRFVALANLTYW